MTEAPAPSQKKTRKRLRVTCVECTRRRQKCDRKQPCGLCKSRNVEHLCRWETVPFARPKPVRPPGTAKGARSTRSTSGSQNSMSPESPDIAPGLAPPQKVHAAVDYEVKEAAIALAQLSVAKPGEYLGTGSLVCALHTLDDAEHRHNYEMLSDLPFGTGNEYASAISNSFSISLGNLLSNLPIQARCDELITSFFERENWRFALPRQLVFGMYNHMWNVFHADPAAASRIRIQWAALLFGIFACSPACISEEESRKYFLQGLTARRLAEDLFAASFTAQRVSQSTAEGTAQACLAAALLAKYMCDRGQVSEAWKMIGTAIRSAQNIGLHINPASGKWKSMTAEEQTMRFSTWLLLFQQDLFMSFVLGRPSVIRACDTDVPLPNVPEGLLAADGSSDLDSIYRACMLQLISVVGGLRDKYLCLKPTPLVDPSVVDTEFELWERSLPPYFHMRHPDTSFDYLYLRLQLQRYNLAVYYFSCRMIIHRALHYCMYPRIFEHRDIANGLANESCHSKCAKLAIEVLRNQRLMCANCSDLLPRQASFASTFLIFEAAVTLCITILHDSTNPQRHIWQEEMGSVVGLLEHAQGNDSGGVVQQAIAVLRVLRDKLGSPHGDPALFNIGEPFLGGVPSAYINHSWPQVPVLESATSANNMPPQDLMQSLNVPTEWMTDSRGGGVTAYNLLRSLD